MKKINESFTCVWCGEVVPIASKTCRNHCPYCFTSLHVDGDIPWDRASLCHGIMRPINYEIRNWEMKILFKCEKCWKLHRNKRASDDDIEKLLDIVKNNPENLILNI
jgi:DNA-directed RNA polymerase subunit RPC12/RpoP